MNPITYEEQREALERLGLAGKVRVDETVPPGIVREDMPVEQYINREERRARAKAARRAKHR